MMSMTNFERRSERKRGTLAVALLALLIATPLGVSAAELPSGEQVLDAYVEATGGAKAHKKIKSRVMNGTMTVVEAGMEGEITSFYSGGDMYFAWEAPGFGKLESGVHDGVAWEVNPMSGVTIKEGESHHSALRMAALDHAVNWRNYYTEVKCVGREDVDGRSCYKVVVTPKGESSKTHYYDAESSLLVKLEGQMASDHGAMNVVMRIGDYREVDGVLVSFELEQKLNDMQTMLFKTKSVEHNTKIPASRFAFPEVVQSKLEPRRTDASQ